jgi:hypothetical protein
VASRGVLFAVGDDVAAKLQDARGDDDAIMAIIEDVEEAWEEPFVAETDKAWDAIHRALTDGALEWANGTYPLNHAILGGLDLMQGDDYIAVLKAPGQVRDVAASIRNVDDVALADRYRAVVPSDYAPEYGEEDLAYTVDWFRSVRDLYQRAAAEGRAVIFTADQ